MHGDRELRGSAVEYFYYVCKATKRRYSVKKELIETTVADGVREMLEDKDLCRRLAERHVQFLSETEDNAPAIEAAKAELRALERQRDNIIDAVAGGSPVRNVQSEGRQDKR